MTFRRFHAKAALEPSLDPFRHRFWSNFGSFREQLWPLGGFRGACGRNFTAFVPHVKFRKEKCVGKGPRDPPNGPSAVVGLPLVAAKENTHFLVKVMVLPRENHTLRKRSVLQPPKQVT